MLRKRLVLCLLVDGSFFVNSRLFDVQPIINLDTIVQHLDFEAIDELVILDVARSGRDLEASCRRVRAIGRNCFVPIAAGGGLASLADMAALLRSGADKVVLNTAAEANPQLVSQAADTWGRQCVVVSIDAKRNRQGVYEVFTRDGRQNTKREVVSWAQEVEALGAGEIFLTSMERDGTGTGYDLELVRRVVDAVTIPVIASGGVGEFQHLVDGLTLGNASAVSLANLFHFLGTSLVKAKQYLVARDVDVPVSPRSCWL